MTDGRRFRLSAIAVVILAASGCTAETGAPDRQGASTHSYDRSQFGIAKAGICTGEQCPIPPPPPEIAQARHGFYVYEADTYSGRWASWTGVDLDLRRVVKVERFRGAIMGDAEKSETSTDTDYVRTSDRMVEIVNIREIGGEALDEVACSANRLWTDTTPPAGQMYDMTVRIGLRDGDATKVIGGHDQSLPRIAWAFVKEILSRFGPPQSKEL